MSNRLRILFLDRLTNKVHVGNRALRALEDLYLSTQKDTALEGGVAEKMASKVSQKGRGIFDWVVAANDRALKGGAKELPQIPESLRHNKLKFAQWLFRRLPEAQRAVTFVMVTREARHNRWKRSECNPKRYSKQMAAKDLDKQTAYVFGSGLYDGFAKDLLNSKEQYIKEKQAQWQAQKKTKKPSYPPYKVVKNVPKAPTASSPNYPWESPPTAVDEEFGVPVPGQVGPSGATPPVKKQQQPKSKLRVGIWA